MTEDDSSIPALDDVIEFPNELDDGEYRWLVLFEEDYDNVVLDVEGNVGLKLDLDQAGEVTRLAAEALAELSHQDADGDDVLRDMAAGLEAVRDE